MKLDMQNIIMNLILNAGDAKSDCILAIQDARKKNFCHARKLLEEADQKILKIHKLQNDLMQQECRGEKIEVSMMMIHAQDHLTNALVTFDLANEFVSYIEENG